MVSSPALRLYNVFVSAQKTTSAKNGGPKFKVWSEVCVSANPEIDSSGALETCARILDLIAHTRKIVSATDMTQQAQRTYLGYLEPLKNMAKPQKINEKWSLSGNDIAFLLTLDDALQARGVKEVVVANLSDIKDELEQILTDLNDADIDEYIRIFLIESVNSLLYCIRNAEYLGPNALRRAYVATLSDLSVVRSDELSEEGQDLWSRVRASVGKIPGKLNQADKVLTFHNKIWDAVAKLPDV